MAGMTEKTEWTDAQLEAIEAEGGDILVSAAAGSGKTTAMTERIIRRIKAGGDITRMLVVTFSKASAADMKKKIADAIRRAAAEDPADRRLRRQLTRIEGADIKTIDAFCASVVKRYFGQLGLTPRVRVADEAEMRLLRDECMRRTVDGFFAGDSGAGTPADDIVMLADHIAGGRDGSEMEKTLGSLYTKTSCLPRRFYVIADDADRLEAAGVRGFLDSSYGAGIKKTAAEGIEYYVRAVRAGCLEIAKYEKYAKAYGPGFEGTVLGLERIKAALDAGDYSAAAAALGEYSPPNLGRGDKEKPGNIGFFAKKRKEAGAFVAKLRENFFSVPDEALERSIMRTVSVCRGIVRVLEKFDRMYTEEKRRRCLLDYSDIEHMTGELLQDRDIADAVAGQYDEIYIDEYQDVNETQDMIFSALSRNNRFMVGDVKQSIYGFRGSDPTLFDEYRRRIGAIYMSDNFRCDEPIVEFTNAVCGKLLPFGSVSYGEEDALRHGKKDKSTPEPVRIVITDADSEAEEVAELAAAEIARGTRPADIAILMRSAKGRAEAITDALRRRGVTAENGARDNFFDSPEILLVLSLLHLCDNPLYDIYTAGALRSPAFGFTLDELIRIKSGDSRPLWRVLRDAAGGEGALAQKCRAACATVERWRESSRTMAADEVIAMLYRETGIEALLWSEKNRREDAPPEFAAGNLRTLYEYARSFERDGFRGLHRFVSFVDSLIERGAESPAPASGSPDAVKLLTVHKSKGLEFPVVILAGCGSRRNEEDAKPSVLYSRRAGAAMRLRADDEGKSVIVADTLPRIGVAETILREGAAEEMRVLYVALTRAKERLYVTAGVGNPEKTAAEAQLEAELLSAYTVTKKKTYIEWILTALFAAGDGCPYTVEIKAPAEEAPEAASAEETDDAAAGAEEVPREAVEAYREKIRERFSYRYPFERLGALPAKLSVSRLKPGILDTESVELVSAPAAEAPGESALAGTATHIYMQFCDFSSAERDAVAEGERLLSRGFIKKEDFERIRFPEIEAFFRSEVYARIKASREVYRERRFNVRLPAAEFTENAEDRESYRDETLLVQGVIDCFFREADGGIVLLDYKTDRLSPYELSHREAAEAALRGRHARQLSYYKAALTRIFGVPPKEALVYSMCLGDAVSVE